MTPHQSLLHQLLFYRGSWRVQCVLFTIHFVVTCNLLIGYKTPMASFLHYLLTISLQERMYYVLDGGDRLFRHLAFWLIFLPSWHGDTTSIDAVLLQNKRKRCLAMHIADHHKATKKGTRTSSIHYLNGPDPTGSRHALSRDSTVRSPATAAILLQSMIIYTFIMLNRMRGPQETWSLSQCTAVHHSMAAYTMSTDWGMYPSAYPMLCLLLCRVTVLCESVLPILILLLPFDIVKLAILLTLSGMQFGFNVFIRVENFGWSMAACSVLFLPPLFWDEIATSSVFAKCSMTLRGG